MTSSKSINALPFNFTREISSTIALSINALQQLIVSDAAVDSTTSASGDIWVPTNSGLGASIGNISGRFEPLGSGNHTWTRNNYSAGKIKFAVSNGINNNQIEAWDINSGGSFESIISGQGIILKSPGGNRFKISVSDTGVLNTSSL